MSSAALVRRARAEDIGSLLQLERAMPEAPHWTETAYREYIEASTRELLRKALWIAVSGDRVCGFAAASAVVGEAELETIAVEACMRQQGLGSRLLATAVSWARSSGAATLLLEVRSANASAQAFYHSRGFLQKGCRPRYYSDPEDNAIVMGLELTGRRLRQELASPGEL